MVWAHHKITMQQPIHIFIFAVSDFCNTSVGYYNQSCLSCGLYLCYHYFICIHVYFMDFFILQMGYWLQRQTLIWWNTFTDKGKRHRYSTLAQLLSSVWQQTCCPTTNSKLWHRTSRETQQTRWWNPVPIQETESRTGKITNTRRDPTSGRQNGLICKPDPKNNKYKIWFNIFISQKSYFSLFHSFTTKLLENQHSLQSWP